MSQQLGMGECTGVYRASENEGSGRFRSQLRTGGSDFACAMTVKGKTGRSADEAETDSKQPFIYVDRAAESWLKVPRALTFSRCHIDGMYAAKIRIQNQSLFNVAYCVRTSSEAKLNIKSRTGWVGALKEVDVIVMSRPTKVKDFGDLCPESLTVFATPIIFGSQLQAKKIRLLWNVYGTKVFPLDAAEVHKVDQFVPAFETYMDNYNIIAKAAMGTFVAPKHVTEMEFPVTDINEVTFYTNWKPTETGPELCQSLDSQVQNLKLKVMGLRERVEALALDSKMICTMILTVALTCGLTLLTRGPDSFFQRNFGPNGNFLVPDEPEPEPVAWWKFW